jgi:major vault protein
LARFQYEIIRVPPFHYLHVLDNNANVVRVVEGPSRYTCLGHEKVILGPEPMYAPLSSPRSLLSLSCRSSLVSCVSVRRIVVPPRHYATIENPVLKDGATTHTHTHTPPHTHAHNRTRAPQV